ncbi:hypothetical protein HJC23_012091 [Cyclotella cryptica]|uniref:AAR2 C-terminal domain-containing protein n=1 Tax=Cyclotella cryptica TaxID=29204 RepID=A0ABD3PV47_9STRA
MNDTGAGGCIILLDVPPRSSIALDGITRVTPSSPLTSAPRSSSSSGFNRGLFIIDSISASSQFHLLVVRCGTSKERSKHDQNHGGSLPVGFVLLSKQSAVDGARLSSNYGYDWIFARRYDRQTEEISNKPLDEVTLGNLMLAITEQGGELKKIIMPYEQFMGSSNDSKNILSWTERTSLIDHSFLQKRHNLCHGDKIIPSCESSCDDRDVSYSSNMKDMSTETDGTSITYPPIPCIDRAMSARQLSRHSGTRSYISTLHPSLRTWLLSGGECCSPSDAQVYASSPEEYIWKDLLNRYCNADNDDRREGEHNFLADIQFAFLIFLFLECHSSLEHWRDAVSMSSLTMTTPTTFESTRDARVQTYSLPIHQSNFTLQLLSTLYAQLSCIETDFFQEVEYSSGDNNFLVGALRRLRLACGGLDEMNETVKMIKKESSRLDKLALDRFHLQISTSPNLSDNSFENEVANKSLETEADQHDVECDDDNLRKEQLDPDEMDDEDGPVIVPISEVEASISRSSVELLQAQKHCTFIDAENEYDLRTRYPLLYAAMAPQEDLLMCCARILDDRNDVSLVREAASYLETVEAHRT